jgi:predicted permease
MRDLLSDLRYALRTFAKSPVFAGVAVLSLALGIGANTAIFTLLDQVLLRLLPVRDPEQLVQLQWEGSFYGSNTGYAALSYPMYKDFRDRNQVFSDVICRYALPLSLGISGEGDRLDGELVSGNYFQVLGVKAAIGRTITPDDDRIPGGHPVAVLSYRYWVERFHSDPAVIGQSLLINGRQLSVIGVSQAGFDSVEIGYSPKIRIPVAMKKEMTPGWEMYSLENRRGRWVNVFGRLKPGVGITQAKASLQPLFHSILEMEVREKEFAHAGAYTKQQFLRSTMNVLPGARGRLGLRRQAESPLWVLMAMVGLVLLIACANVANLLMARATGRQKEIAVRLAMGASRLRLMRQLMVESLLLALAGGAAGLLVAAWTDSLLLRLMPTGNSALELSTTPDSRILIFALSVSCLTGIVFGLAPALQSTRPDLASTLKESAGTVVGGGHMRLRKALVVAQIFLSLLLLIGAGLFIRSLRNLKTLDPGFRTHNVVAFSIDPRLNGYTKERAHLYYRELLDKLRGTPGVESASFAIVRVLDNDDWESTIAVDGYEPKPDEDMSPYYNAVSPGYCATLGLKLVAGREFLPSDIGNSHKVGIVNEKWAHKYFGGRNALGRHFGFGGDPGTKTDIEIVGVVKDAKYNNMRDEMSAQNFVPFDQTDIVTEVTLYVRTQLDPEQMFTAVRGSVHGLDANLPIYGMRTLDSQLDQSLVAERLTAYLAAVFGFLATLLAAVGLYGVMAYNVGRRTREIGIRMALGAPSPSVMWLVMREVLVMLGLGVAVAVPAAWALARLVQSQLYGIAPSDPMSMAAATLAIALVAALAGYIPALRATRIDPIGALRYE